MKKMFKIILAGIAMVVSVSLFAGCGNNYVFNEEDFRLTLSVDKTEARVGDTVTAHATFENLSGRDINVRARFSTVDDPDNLLQFLWMLESDEISQVDLLGFVPSPPRRIIEKDAVFEKQRQFTIQRQENRIVKALVFFRLGREWKMISEEVKITVQGVN